MANFNPYRMVNPYPGMNLHGTSNLPQRVPLLPSMYQQQPYNPQNFYQMEMAKHFQCHMEFMNGKYFKFDSNGKLLLYQFQCSKCLKLCEFENVVLSHFDDCDQFSFKFSDCRNRLYTARHV